MHHLMASTTIPSFQNMWHHQNSFNYHNYRHFTKYFIQNKVILLNWPLSSIESEVLFFCFFLNAITKCLKQLSLTLCYSIHLFCIKLIWQCENHWPSWKQFYWSKPHKNNVDNKARKLEFCFIIFKS